MEILSLNVGLPREVIWKGMAVRTGIFKESVHGQVHVGKLNLAGDRQADLTVHGGKDKAVYGYPAEHYQFWRNELPDISLAWGNFGENLTTTGLDEKTLHIGDKLRIGSAMLQVTQPRLPCYKLALRFDRDDIVRRFLLSRRSGFYFAVLEEGELTAGSAIEVISRDAQQVSVTDIINLFLGEEHDEQLLQRTLNLEALPDSWKQNLPDRVHAIRENRASR